jgi:hypothetical protein
VLTAVLAVSLAVPLLLLLPDEEPLDDDEAVAEVSDALAVVVAMMVTGR